MKFSEILLVAGLVLLIGRQFWQAYRSKDETLFWSPLTLFSAIFAYYFVVGPLISLLLGNTSGYGIQFRDIMWKAWLAGLLGLGAIFAGFALPAMPWRTKLNEGFTPDFRRRLRRFCFLLTGFGLVGFVYDAYVSGQSLGMLLLPFHRGGNLEADVAGHEGLAAGNYLFLLINVFIPAMALWCALQADQPWRRWIPLVVLPAVQIAFFYSSMGFRHRIVIMILSMAATTYLMQRKRPHLWTILLAAVGMLLMAGLIVLTRTYGMGLDLSQIAGMGLIDILLGGFNDAGTFFTTALVIDSIPKTFPYVGLNPLWIALTIPIPRSLWPDKPLPIFLQYFQYLTGTMGQAVPVVGEHYMMGGWIGLLIGGLLIGMLYRRFWEFYRANPGNPLVIVLYAVSWALIFPVINRGYLAQTLMEFFFDLLPLVVLYLGIRKMMLAPAAKASRVSVRVDGPAEPQSVRR